MVTDETAVKRGRPAKITVRVGSKNYTLRELAEEHNLPYSVVYKRFREGVVGKQLIETYEPTRKRKPKPSSD